MARARTVRWLQGILTVVAVFGAFYLFLIFIQPYRQQMLLAEKRGRVVDAESGEGLAGVAVVTNYYSTFFTPLRTSSGCIHQKIVRTDADGFYVVPDAAKDIDVADTMFRRMLPGFSKTYGWVQLYYKDGYIRAGEASRYLKAVEANRNPGTISRAIIYSKERGGYMGPPVDMNRFSEETRDLSVDAYLTYIRHLSNGMWCYEYSEGHSKELMALQNEIRAAGRRLVCDLPPGRMLAPLARRFAFADCASTIGIKKIRARKGNRDGVADTAGDMCESYRYVPDQYECQEGEVNFPPLKIVNSRASKAKGEQP